MYILVSAAGVVLHLKLCVTNILLSLGQRMDEADEMLNLLTRICHDDEEPAPLPQVPRGNI
jgi:hypothetical protein